MEEIYRDIPEIKFPEKLCDINEKKSLEEILKISKSQENSLRNAKTNTKKKEIPKIRQGEIPKQAIEEIWKKNFNIPREKYFGRFSFTTSLGEIPG